MGADTFLRVQRDAVREDDPGTDSRRPKSGVAGLSAQRGSYPPRTWAVRALRWRILSGACAHHVRRAALRLPSGSRSGLQLCPRRSPGRPLCSRQEPGGHGPSRRPQLQPVFVASSRSTARQRLAVPRSAWGCEGGRLLRGCTHLQRPRFLAGQCTDPRRLQRAATRTYWPLLLLLRALGVGGGEAGEWRQRRRQRAAEARMAAQGA